MEAQEEWIDYYSEKGVEHLIEREFTRQLAAQLADLYKPGAAYSPRLAKVIAKKLFQRIDADPLEDPTESRDTLNNMMISVLRAELKGWEDWDSAADWREFIVNITKAFHSGQKLLNPNKDSIDRYDDAISG
jgi:hypothetical protein